MRIGLIVISIFLLRFLVGCWCDCDPDFNNITWSSVHTEIRDVNGHSIADSIKSQYIFLNVRVNYTITSYRSSGDYVYADCLCLYRNTDSIADLQVFTLIDFNSETKKGSNITDCFKVKESRFSSPHTIREVINDINNEVPIAFEAKLFLVKQPDYSGSYQFIVNVILESGKELVDTTESVYLISAD